MHILRAKCVCIMHVSYDMFKYTSEFMYETIYIYNIYIQRSFSLIKHNIIYEYIYMSL